MTYLDDPEAGMTTVHGTTTDHVVLQIDDVNRLPTHIYNALVECAAFVNWRRIEKGEEAVLTLSFYKSV
jgi:hypothetical protein